MVARGDLEQGALGQGVLGMVLDELFARLDGLADQAGILKA